MMAVFVGNFVENGVLQPFMILPPFLKWPKKMQNA